MKAFWIVLLWGIDKNPTVSTVVLFILLLPAFYLLFLFLKGLGLVFSNGNKEGSPTTESTSAVIFHLNDFIYFRKLTAARKAEFAQRVINFLESHDIEGTGEFEPSLNAKIHVAAAATQLTFGLEDFTFSYFETIILFPGIFRLQEGGPLMKGATTPNGIIRISIKDFDQGFANPSDKLNVGLHELGHALFMEFLKEANTGEEEMTEQDIYPYLQESDKMLRKGKFADNFLRDYAFTNRHEFFAVSVEHFFEAPLEFKEKLPELFSVLKNLLKQDLTSTLPDYGINRN